MTSFIDEENYGSDTTKLIVSDERSEGTTYRFFAYLEDAKRFLKIFSEEIVEHSIACEYIDLVCCEFVTEMELDDLKYNISLCYGRMSDIDLMLNSVNLASKFQKLE